MLVRTALLAGDLANHEQKDPRRCLDLLAGFEDKVKGMSKEQVLILLDAPDRETTDAAEMEKLARKYWPQIRGKASEAWSYPLGWQFYFAESRLVDIIQYQPRR